MTDERILKLSDCHISRNDRAGDRYLVESEFCRRSEKGFGSCSRLLPKLFGVCSYPSQVLYWLKGLDAGENDDTEVVGLPVVWAFSELLCGTARNQPTLRTVASRHPFAVQQKEGHATYLVAAERTANVAVIVRAADAGQTVAAGT